MTALNNLFATSANATSTVKELAGTSMVNTLAGVVTDRIFDAVNENAEELGALLVESQTNMTVLEELIDNYGDLESLNIDNVKELSESTLEAMLKSQQSKRSRTRSKEMTIDNYTAMLTAAVAERIIREALGKPKSHGGAKSTTGLYDEATLAKYAEDQELLKKELRNVQSKKSIERRKADFDINSERWTMLLAAEDQLKSVRATGGRPVIQRGDETKDAIREMLAEVDIERLKAQEARDLLMSIFTLVFDDEEEIAEETDGDENQEDSNDETTDEEHTDNEENAN